MNKVLIGSLLFLSVLGILPHFSAAITPEELQAQIEATRRSRESLVEEQKRLEAELQAINRESQSLGTAVKSLDATRKKLANDISITQSKISQASLSIKMLESTSAKKEEQIVTHRLALATALQTLADYDTRSFITDLLTYGEMSDVWRDRGTLADVNDRLASEVVALREARIALANEKEVKEKTRVELVGLQGELGGQKAVVEVSQNAKQKLLNETKSKEAAYQKMLADNIARQKQSEADLFRLESELKVVLDPTLIPSAAHSILAWPLDNVYITQRFGRTSGSARLYASGTHNGVDFRAAMGTPVKAMLSGTVEGTGNTDEQKGCYSFGRWILIKHNNGLSSVYAHLSGSVVSKGQVVSTGDVIGYSGGTPGVYGSGYSTGPHLHIGLFASQGVAVRQFTTSIGCKQVFVPIADSRAYLDPLAYLPGI